MFSGCFVDSVTSKGKDPVDEVNCSITESVIVLFKMSEELQAGGKGESII